jgi:hypothetical protein
MLCQNLKLAMEQRVKTLTGEVSPLLETFARHERVCQEIILRDRTAAQQALPPSRPHRNKKPTKKKQAQPYKKRRSAVPVVSERSEVKESSELKAARQQQAASLSLLEPASIFSFYSFNFFVKAWLI